MATTMREHESKGERTRRTILEAAVARFGRDGFRATSVTDIARDAGVSGSLAYAYFTDKSDLFLAALDDDIVGIIDEGVASIIAAGDDSWRTELLSTLIAAVERHPLARRILAGLEPDASERMIELPALEELRATVIERLRQDQAAGRVRTDIDEVAVGRGTVSIFIALLMAAVQFGDVAAADNGRDVLAVIEAAIDVSP
ncbi:MAG: TetR/AcrR family transcriptional regulator [Acidimicrobiales bacterium]